MLTHAVTDLTEFYYKVKSCRHGFLSNLSTTDFKVLTKNEITISFLYLDFDERDICQINYWNFNYLKYNANVTPPSLRQLIISFSLHLFNFQNEMVNLSQFHFRHEIWEEHSLNSVWSCLNYREYNWFQWKRDLYRL